MKKITLFIFLLGLLSAPAFSQVKHQLGPDYVAGLIDSSYYDYQRTSGFLGFDPSKIKMDQSYTLSVGTFGAQSITQGMYLNTLSYQFTTPLSMKVQWGFMHQPFGMNDLASQFFISGAELKYQPFKNTSFRLQFRQYPRGYYSPYDYRTSGWSHPLNRGEFDEE